MSTVEVDDLSIANDCRLFRRVPMLAGGLHALIVWDDNLKSWQPSSLAFGAHPDNPRAFSVHLESVLIERGLDVESVILDRSKFALAAFTAGQARQENQVLERAPEPDQPAHAHVVGEKTTKVRKRLKRCAVWVIPPEIPPPTPAAV